MIYNHRMQFLDDLNKYWLRDVENYDCNVKISGNGWVQIAAIGLGHLLKNNHLYGKEMLRWNGFGTVLVFF